jgi:hypothetical protein
MEITAFAFKARLGEQVKARLIANEEITKICLSFFQEYGEVNAAIGNDGQAEVLFFPNHSFQMMLESRLPKKYPDVRLYTTDDVVAVIKEITQNELTPQGCQAIF